MGTPSRSRGNAAPFPATVRHGVESRNALHHHHARNVHSDRRCVRLAMRPASRQGITKAARVVATPQRDPTWSVQSKVMHDETSSFGADAWRHAARRDTPCEDADRRDRLGRAASRDAQRTFAGLVPGVHGVRSRVRDVPSASVVHRTASRGDVRHSKRGGSPVARLSCACVGARGPRWDARPRAFLHARCIVVP